MRLLHETGTYDGLDLTTLVSVEIIMRKVQQFEYGYARKMQEKKSGGGNSGQGSISEEILGADEAFSGLSHDRGMFMCSPELLESVTKDMENKSGILKQIRKAKMERDARDGALGGGKKKDA